MNELWQIRRAQQGDSAAVKALIDELENRISERHTFSAIYEEYLHAPDTLMYVIEQAQAGVVAFISCKGQRLLHHEGLVFEIQEMIVNQAHRGHGYGRILFNKIREEVQLRGAKSLEVTSNKRRKEAHAFYQSMGFQNSHEKFTIYF